jgi:hypothetical protein
MHSTDWSYIIYRQGEEIGVYQGSQIEELWKNGTLHNADTYLIEGRDPPPQSLAHMCTVLGLVMSFKKSEQQRRLGPGGWITPTGRKLK